MVFVSLGFAACANASDISTSEVTFSTGGNPNIAIKIEGENAHILVDGIDMTKRTGAKISLLLPGEVYSGVQVSLLYPSKDLRLPGYVSLQAPSVIYYTCLGVCPDGRTEWSATPPNPSR